MAGPFDSLMKRLIRQYGKHFSKWLDPDATFVQGLNIELQSQHIFADALLRVVKRNKPALQHLEIQRGKDAEMEVRLLEYNILASRQYGHIPVYSYVIYLSDVGQVQEPPYIRRFPDDEGEEVFRFYYRVIKLAEIAAESILALEWIGLLPFITLTKGGKRPEIVNTMIHRLAEAKETDLLAASHVIGGLVFKQEAEKDWFRRRFLMFQDILKESWVYEEIGQESFEEGKEEGKVQGRQEDIISFLQVRFPEVLALANQQINSIKDPTVLQTILTKLYAAKTSEEAKQLLLDVNRH